MIKPFKKNILVELKEREKVLDSGIILPDAKRTDMLPLEGRVVDVGSEVTQIKAGNWVHFEPYSLTTVKDEKLSGDFDPDRLAIVHEDKVFVILT